ncbi:response regulator transcription factor [Spirosoma linguale]|uniref:Two component transcriptional regulator, winged helix family n=1 Tax=Spirosoma linguale (strain ATCC 33905 / DSM 74 / LMG 10896 / Claus 1) TaxID=504472 RepID=D2QV60_SPILD|nr:two component transcriptional regulator, winged helix family [Spirosoma linguale DSM 74]
MKILLIEDEPSLLVALQQYLEGEQYQVSTATNLRTASLKVHDYDYDCVVVDITLPDGNGLAIVNELKEAHSSAGIIIVSAKNSLDDKLSGLELGADDYLTKPFHLPELNARIRSLMRRRQHAGETQLTCGAITIVPHRKQVLVANQPMDVTGKEYELLLFMATNKNRLLSKAIIVEHVWGDYMDGIDSHDFLYTHVRNLRRKLLDAGSPDYITTRYGAGYIFTVGE